MQDEARAWFKRRTLVQTQPVQGAPSPDAERQGGRGRGLEAFLGPVNTPGS